MKSVQSAHCNGTETLLELLFIYDGLQRVAIQRVGPNWTQVGPKGRTQSPFDGKQVHYLNVIRGLSELRTVMNARRHEKRKTGAGVLIGSILIEIKWCQTALKRPVDLKTSVGLEIERTGALGCGALKF